MGVFGMRKPIFDNGAVGFSNYKSKKTKKNMRAPGAPTQHQASLLRAGAELGQNVNNAGWTAPIKMPNAQIKGHEAPA